MFIIYIVVVFIGWFFLGDIIAKLENLQPFSSIGGLVISALFLYKIGVMTTVALTIPVLSWTAVAMLTGSLLGYFANKPSKTN